MTKQDYLSSVAQLPYGKQLPTAIYLLDVDDERVPWLLRTACAELRRRLGIGPEHNLLKFSLSGPRISFLAYPDFDRNPHPQLASAVVVDLVTGKVRRDEYRGRKNPPILHRKELFVPPEHPRRDLFTRLTESEEAVGLLDDTARIGFRLNWERLLAARGITIRGHSLRHDQLPATELVDQTEGAVHVARDKTALARTEASRPVKLLLELNQLSAGNSFFDYGCGLGTDLRFIAALGLRSQGWDPAHAPDNPKVEADVVNLGFVLNVIEDSAERVETLLDAWKLARRLLVVSTLVAGDENYAEVTTFADGVLTKRSTFQKYFEQGELHALIEDTLHFEAAPVALGVFFVFRQVSDLHDFLAARTKRFIDWGGISRKLGLVRATTRRRDPYETHRELLEEFWETALRLGRIPRDDEFAKLTEIRSACESVPKAFQLLFDRFGNDTFEVARARRREDLLVYAAASQLRKRIPFAQLSLPLQHDIRSHFGTYAKAEEQARELLFASGDADELELALAQVKFGELDPVEGHLTFHRDLLDELPAIFRAYVACGARLFGDPRQADLIKIHLHSKKLTFLHYEQFIESAFPQLQTRIKIDLRRMFVTVFQYPRTGERQLLLFKERFVARDHPTRKEMEILSGRLRAAGVTPETVGHGPSATEFGAWLRARGFDAQLRKNPAVTSTGDVAPLRTSPKGP